MSITDRVFSSREEARQADMAEGRDRATFSQIAAAVSMILFEDKPTKVGG